MISIVFTILKSIIPSNHPVCWMPLFTIKEIVTGHVCLPTSTCFLERKRRKLVYNVPLTHFILPLIEILKFDWLRQILNAATLCFLTNLLFPIYPLHVTNWPHITFLNLFHVTLHGILHYEVINFWNRFRIYVHFRVEKQCLFKIARPNSSQNFMDTAKTIDLTRLCIQIYNTVVLSKYTHIKLTKKSKTKTLSIYNVCWYTFKKIWYLHKLTMKNRVKTAVANQCTWVRNHVSTFHKDLPVIRYCTI